MYEVWKKVTWLLCFNGNLVTWQKRQKKKKKKKNTQPFLMAIFCVTYFSRSVGYDTPVYVRYFKGIQQNNCSRVNICALAITPGLGHLWWMLGTFLWSRTGLIVYCKNNQLAEHSIANSRAMLYSSITPYPYGHTWFKECTTYPFSCVCADNNMLSWLRSTCMSPSLSWLRDSAWYSLSLSSASLLSIKSSAIKS